MPVAAPPAETAWLLAEIVGFTAMDQPDIAAILEESTRTAEGEKRRLCGRCSTEFPRKAVAK